MKSLLLLLLVYHFHSSYAVLLECEPPIPHCKCDVKVLKCNDCRSFPPDVPANITEFIFDGCDFETEVKDLPYRQAEVLEILRSPNRGVVDGAFSNLADLKTLRIESSLKEVRSEMFDGLSKLKTLSLNRNLVTTVPAAVFDSMPMLDTLILSFNAELTITPGSFSGLDNLETLDLNDCGLSEVPVDAIKDLKKLKVLTLNSNKLTSVPGKAFDGLESLQEIRLNRNNITEVEEEAFEGLHSLLVLDLSFNSLKELDEDALDSSDELKKLYLEHNQFQSVPEDLVEWDHLTMLTMSHNPWVCDCGNYWMQELHFSPTEDITCASPAEFLGHDLHNVTLSLECSLTSRSTIVMAVIIPLMIICTCLIVYFVYKMVQTKKRREGQRNVRYSSVYKDTVETVSGGKKGKPMPEL